MGTFDVVVIGAGIAGASAAYEMAADRSVLLLEQEAHPGHHTTGRSAALFSETYGNAAIRALTAGSRGFLRAAARRLRHPRCCRRAGSSWSRGPTRPPGCRTGWRRSGRPPPP